MLVTEQTVCNTDKQTQTSNLYTSTLLHAQESGMQLRVNPISDGKSLLVILTVCAEMGAIKF